MTFIHPRKNAARSGFYPYRVTVYSSAGSAIDDDETASNYQPVAGLEDLPAALEVSPTTSSAPFEREVPSGEKLLLNEYVPSVRRGHHVAVSLAEWSKRYEVSDVEPAGMGTQTILTLLPIL